MDRLTHGLAFALCLTKNRAAACYGFLPPNSEDEHGGQSHGQSRHQDRERQQRDSFVESHLISSTEKDPLGAGRSRQAEIS
jgi:hypothetical protein